MFLNKEIKNMPKQFASKSASKIEEEKNPKNPAAEIHRLLVTAKNLNNKIVIKFKIKQTLTPVPPACPPW
jgi:hypothetical protein